MFAVWHLLSLVFHVFISIAFTVRSSKSSSFMIIIIGIQLARCTRVASRESLPRAVAETVTQRPRPRPTPRPRPSKTVAETETESRDEATSTSASHTQMANKRSSRVYFMLPAEAEAAETEEARSATRCIRAHRTSNKLHVVFEVRAVCSVATVLFIFRPTLSEGTTAAYA